MKKLSEHCAGILSLIDDPTREGLAETPERMSKFYQHWTTRGDPDFKCTEFSSESYDQMIVQVGIKFYSLCEHHVLPFFGEAMVGYLPQKKIIGLSKLARIVQHYASRLQNQERLTQQVAEFLYATLNARGVGVCLSARHLCMEMRGVKNYQAITTTTHLCGEFRSYSELKSEFLSHKK